MADVFHFVMAGRAIVQTIARVVPAIHDFSFGPLVEAWMPATSAGMTEKVARHG
jgi:hypothetical protein